MSKSEEPKKRWSLTFKAQLIACALFILVVPGVLILGRIFLDPNSESAKGFFYGWIRFYGPCIAIIRALGMEQRFSPLAYDISMLVVNTLIVFCMVGVVGKTIGFIWKKATKS